jgi:hypothetical protein
MCRQNEWARKVQSCMPITNQLQAIVFFIKLLQIMMNLHGYKILFSSWLKLYIALLDCRQIVKFCTPLTQKRSFFVWELFKEIFVEVGTIGSTYANLDY